MKKFLVLVGLVVSSFAYSQKIKSVTIMHPKTNKVLSVVSDPNTFARKVDSLNNIYKTNAFILLSLYTDGVVKQSLIKRKKSLPKKITLKRSFNRI